jgi:hypothetical protein
MDFQEIDSARLHRLSESIPGLLNVRTLYLCADSRERASHSRPLGKLLIVNFKVAAHPPQSKNSLSHGPFTIGIWAAIGHACKAGSAKKWGGGDWKELIGQGEQFQGPKGI